MFGKKDFSYKHCEIKNVVMHFTFPKVSKLYNL